MDRGIWTTRIASVLLCIVMGAPFPVQGGQPAGDRFRMEAKLEPQPELRIDQRFALRASLRPQAAAARQQSSGLMLKARLSPAADPLCPAPGRIFGDSFESP